MRDFMWDTWSDEELPKNHPLYYREYEEEETEEFVAEWVTVGEYEYLIDEPWEEIEENIFLSGCIKKIVNGEEITYLVVEELLVI